MLIFPPLFLRLNAWRWEELKILRLIMGLFGKITSLHKDHQMVFYVALKLKIHLFHLGLSAVYVHWWALKGGALRQGTWSFCLVIFITLLKCNCFDRIKSMCWALIMRLSNMWLRKLVYVFEGLLNFILGTYLRFLSLYIIYMEMDPPHFFHY